MKQLATKIELILQNLTFITNIFYYMEYFNIIGSEIGGTISPLDE